MTSTLAQRLRDNAESALEREAADEIERLQRELVPAHRLRAALKAVTDSIFAHQEANTQSSDEEKTRLLSELQAAEVAFKAECSPVATSCGDCKEYRAALKVAQQFLLEFSHAQESGPSWYTRGEHGMYSQVNLWLRKGLEAVQGALGPYDDNGQYLKEKAGAEPSEQRSAQYDRALEDHAREMHPGVPVMPAVKSAAEPGAAIVKATKGLRLAFEPGICGLKFVAGEGKYPEANGPTDMAYINSLIEADERP